VNQPCNYPEVDKQLALSEWSIHERRCAAPAFYFSQLSR
jgi:hypothetical protein